MTQQFWQGFSQEEYIFLTIAFIFFTGGILCVMFLFLSRIIKTYNQKKETRLQRTFQQPLNSILFNEDHEMPEASYKFHVQQLQNSIGDSRFAKQVIIRQLIRMKKSISGSSSNRLDRVYRALHLEQFSLQKLSSLHWKLQAQGIRELTEMNYYNPAVFSKVKANTKNKTLHEEILMATVRLDDKDPFSFFNGYTGDVSHWMQINIHHYLSMKGVRALPEFSKWFNHENTDVALFAIRMAKQFRQMNAIPPLAGLLNSENPKLVSAAIDGLTQLNAFQETDKVLQIADRWREDELISRCIVQFLGAVIHDEKNLSDLLRYLDHSSYEVRLGTVTALSNLGEDAKKQLLIRNKTSEGKLDALIRHAADPLLQ